jgi:HEAT repeat protein
MLDHGQPDDQVKVIAAVRHMGPRTLPWLFDLLHARDSPDRQKVADFLNEYTAFTLRPVEPAERLRQRAIPALAALLDQRPNLIVQQLAQELLQTNSSGEVASLLAIAGTNGLAHLLQALTNPAPELRSSAAMALSVPAQVSRQTNPAVSRILGACGITQDAVRMSTNAFFVAAIPALQRCLADSDASVRRAAINSFDLLGQVPTNAIPILITELSGPEAWNRRWSAERLSQFGAVATAAVPALLRTLGDPDETVRTATTNALKLIKPQKAEPSFH